MNGITITIPSNIDLVRLLQGLPQQNSEPEHIPFDTYAENWFVNFKKPNIHLNTYENIYGIYMRHIQPVFGSLYLHQINATMIQKFLLRFIEVGKERTAEDLHNILRGIMTMAYDEGLIRINPMKTVKIPKHYRTNGQPLSKQEINELLVMLEHSPIKYAVILILYSGIRRGELESLEIDGNFLVVTNEKAHRGTPKKKRRIPICESLKTYLPDILSSKYKYNPQYLSTEFKKIMPNHHLHDLRHTFTTRAIESGMEKHYVDYITGHKSNDMTIGVYTHFEDEYGLKEILKLDY